MTDGALVVGYGNALRTDDGIGPRVAAALAGDPRFAGVTVFARHQLTPELALDVSLARLVVLVDAGHGPLPGAFAIAPIEPTGSGAGASSHHLDPETLLALATELYGPVPAAFSIRVGAQSLALGDELTPAVEAALPDVVDALAGLIAAHAGRPAGPLVGSPVHA